MRLSAQTPPRRRRHARAALSAAAALWLICFLGWRAGAAEPIRVGPLQLLLAGEASGSLATRDTDHLNESEYGRSILRLFRVGLTAELKAGPHVALLGELRSENLRTPRVYALYLRLRPWQKHAFDLQAGLVPPVFGAFLRANYGTDPALIGYPLAYHYPTLVRADAAPAGVEQLLRWRGSGWWLRYPIGAGHFDHGFPLVASLRWDTGVQAHLVAKPWELSAALTQGTLGHPLNRDDNGSKQLSGRVAWHPSFGLEAGASVARGGYASRALVASIPAAHGRDFLQRALGLDLEYARGHWILRGEAVWSAWDALAGTAPLLGQRLSARALSVEGRYRPWAGVSLATRLDRLHFGDIQGPAGPVSWDAPVSRIEIGAGYAIQRNLTLKVSYQRNRRSPRGIGPQEFVAIQGMAWF